MQYQPHTTSARALALLLATFFIVSPLTSLASPDPRGNIVDYLWQARQNPNVVDNFIPMSERIRQAQESLQGSAFASNSPVQYQPVSITDYLYDSLGLSQEKPSIHILNTKAHPLEGEEWKIRFTTKGSGDLLISPGSESTKEEDKFISLRCGAQEVEVEHLTDNKILARGWQCGDIGTITHLTLKEGRHSFKIGFSDEQRIAHNGPNSKNVLGLFPPHQTVVAAGNATLNLVQPDPMAGDLMFAVVALRPSASTVNTPSGWTSLGDQAGTDGGAEGVDTGSVRLYTFYKVAAGTEATTSVAFTENGTTSAFSGVIYKVRSASATYEIATSSYPINADATAWGSVLATTTAPDLISGDLIFMIAAQNGNVSNTSAWNITSTGMTGISTVQEQFEYVTTTGNDLEFGVATALVWGGTGYSSPRTTITQGTAASGAVSVVRIRQGAGANRSDAFVRACGVAAGGTTSATPAYPEHERGDLLILFNEARNSTVTQTNPASWGNVGTTSLGGASTFAADTGNSKIAAFYRFVATTTYTGTVTSSIAGAGVTGTSTVAQICSVHRDNASWWDIDVDGGSDNAGGSVSWSVTGQGIDLSENNGGSVVMVASGINTDAYNYSNHAISASGITFSEFNRDGVQNTTSGNDSHLDIASGYVTGGTATNVVPSFTMTSNSSAANAPAGASMFLSLNATTTANVGRTVRLISNKMILHQGSRFQIR